MLLFVLARFDFVSILLSADVTVQDHRGLTPLHWAALQLDAQSLERLCMNIMDVDLSDGQGEK